MPKPYHIWLSYNDEGALVLHINEPQYDLDDKEWTSTNSAVVGGDITPADILGVGADIADDCCVEVNVDIVETWEPDVDADVAAADGNDLVAQA